MFASFARFVNSKASGVQQEDSPSQMKAPSKVAETFNKWSGAIRNAVQGKKSDGSVPTPYRNSPNVVNLTKQSSCFAKKLSAGHCFSFELQTEEELLDLFNMLKFAMAAIRTMQHGGVRVRQNGMHIVERQTYHKPWFVGARVLIRWEEFAFHDRVELQKGYGIAIMAIYLALLTKEYVERIRSDDPEHAEWLDLNNDIFPNAAKLFNIPCPTADSDLAAAQFALLILNLVDQPGIGKHFDVRMVQHAQEYAAVVWGDRAIDLAKAFNVFNRSTSTVESESVATPATSRAPSPRPEMGVGKGVGEF